MIVNNFIVIVILVLIVYILINTFNMLFNYKEKFFEQKDERCKEKGQVFSDFPPGTICAGPGIVKTQ